MSNLSGYDSEAVGFESISLTKKQETCSSTQTTDFGEMGAGTQTNLTKNCGSTATPEELEAHDDVVREYPPPGLNEFLRKVVPSMMEQLNQTDREILYNSSDSEEEDLISAKLLQDITFQEQGLGGGDESSSVLDLSWSSAGNSLAISIGKTQHEDWCTHNGLIKIYTTKRAEGDKFVHNLDISEKNCVTVLEFHPSLAALLAYGTTTGEVVLCNLRNPLEDMQLSSPTGCHGSKRVSALKWAEPHLANIFLTMQISNTGKRRAASDQILISSGSDGTLNVWQVNANLKTFESVVSYFLNGSRNMAAEDISCFDFIKHPLNPYEDNIADDIFVVGSKCGKLYLCKIKTAERINDNLFDPVCDVLEGHGTCVLNVSFSGQKSGTFISLSIDSELRMFDVNQTSPLKVKNYFSFFNTSK